MPRTARFIIDNACYHIITRGNNRQKLFRDQQDFTYLLGLLLEAKDKFQFDLFHYCLMSNHFHLLLRITKASDLAKLLKSIKLSYSFYFRKKYTVSGYLFEGRYKSLLIEKDAYLLDCGRYIERNPLRAKIVRKLEDYPYSSYCFYALGKRDCFITEDILYKDLGRTPKERQAAYRKYVAEDRPYEEIIDKEFVLE